MESMVIFAFDLAMTRRFHGIIAARRPASSLNTLE